jgi:hypothetical protein
MEFIYECDDVFPVDFCNRVIDKFENSDHTKSVRNDWFKDLRIPKKEFTDIPNT